MGKVSTIFIVSILISMAAIGYFALLADVSDTYDVELGEEFSETQDQFDEMLNDTSELGLGIQDRTEQSGGVSFSDAGALLLGGIWSIVKEPFTLVSIFTNMISNIASYIGIPAYVVGGLLALIAIIITFIILSAILKKDL